jgi:hypothetical protein
MFRARGPIAAVPRTSLADQRLGQSVYIAGLDHHAALVLLDQRRDISSFGGDDDIGYSSDDRNSGADSMRDCN